MTVSLRSFFGLFGPLLAAALYISEGIQHYGNPIVSFKRAQRMANDLVILVEQ
jgi:hypothetical protein